VSVTHDGISNAATTYQGALRLHAEYADKVNKLAFELEVKEAELTAQGVEGQNAEQRKATLFIALKGERQALHDARLELAAARLELDCARSAWDAKRYHVRLRETGVYDDGLGAAA